MSSIFSKKTLYMILISLFFCFLCSIYFLLCMLYLKPFRKKKYNMISLFFFSYSLFFSTFHVKFIISYFFSYSLFSFSSLISYFLFVLCSLFSFSSLISYLFYVLLFSFPLPPFFLFLTIFHPSHYLLRLRGTNKLSPLASFEYTSPGRYTESIPVYPPVRTMLSLPIYIILLLLLK